MDKGKTNEHGLIKVKCDKDIEAALTIPMTQQQSISNNQSLIEEEEEPTTINSLLCKLKDIKDMILKLDAKVKSNHHDLSYRVADFSEVKELLTLQNDKIAMLYSKTKELKSQNSTLEKEILEVCEETLQLKVDVSGIPEGNFETYEELQTKIAEVMMSVWEGKSDNAQWETSINIPITNCQRLGTYNKNKRRIVRISFFFMKHKLCLLARKNNLPREIYVDETYPESIKQKQAALRPILKLAWNLDNYKGKCKLEHDQLVIKGIKYNMDTLDRLPEELAPYKSAQCSYADILVFHGKHTPLSNVHTSPLIREGQKFTSAEHYIQYKKACHFNYYITTDKIKHSKDPNEAKPLSHNIINYDKDSWKAVAKDACTPSIRAKFE